MLNALRHRRVCLLAPAICAAAALAAGPARAGTVTMQTCVGQPLPTATWGHAGSPAGKLAAVDNCGQGERMQITGPLGSNTDVAGAYAQWATVLPPSMSLTGVGVPEHAAVINPDTKNAGGTSGYNVRYLWDGGTYTLKAGGFCCGHLDYVEPLLLGIGGRYFIIQAACTTAFCSLPDLAGGGSTPQIFGVKDLTLAAQDNSGPGILAVGQDNLWNHGGSWVRGTWPISTQASDDSGVCNMWDQVDGNTIQGPEAARATSRAGPSARTRRRCRRRSTRPHIRTGH